MTPVIASASPPDLSAIITSLGVFSLAVAAVVGGIYKGLKEVKKGGADTGEKIAAAAIIESTTLTALTESNKLLARAVDELSTVAGSIERRLDKGNDLARELRDALRSSTEEAHRLRVATTDLHQHMRTRV